jgi:hypothetical protein
MPQQPLTLLDDDFPEALPGPSAISVDGVYRCEKWSNAHRAKLQHLTILLGEFDLTIIESPLGAERLRRTWSYRRVNLSTAAIAFSQNYWPGIVFDDWAAYLWGIEADQRETLASRKAARLKARVALSRLNIEGKVAKRVHPRDGRTLLFARADAPDEVSMDFVPPVPPEVKKLREQGVTI